MAVYGVPHGPDEQAKHPESDFMAYNDSEQRKLDFHALRYTTNAWLAMRGVHPKNIQHIMRHSTIVLIMDTYGHLFPGEEAETISHFPDMSSGGNAPMRATGTCDPSPTDSRLALSLAFKGGQHETDTDSNGRLSGPGGIRTRTSVTAQRILSPLRLPIPPQGQVD